VDIGFEQTLLESCYSSVVREFDTAERAWESLRDFAERFQKTALDEKRIVTLKSLGPSSV
jgi:hypothetical protein